MKVIAMKPALMLALILAIFTTLAFAADDDKKAEKDKSDTRAQISIKNIAFKPATVTIKAGQSVVWTNNDDRDHTVEADDGSFKSGKLGAGETYAHAFPKKGKFTYGCSYHPRMKGVVVVE